MKKLIIIMAMLLAAPALAQEIRVIDGDTFEMDGEVIRLGNDRYGRTIARCFMADGGDIGGIMVATGMALADPRYSGSYYDVMTQNALDSDINHLYQDGCMPPWEWRERN